MNGFCTGNAVELFSCWPLLLALAVAVGILGTAFPFELIGTAVVLPPAPVLLGRGSPGIVSVLSNSTRDLVSVYYLLALKAIPLRKSERVLVSKLG